MRAGLLRTPPPCPLRARLPIRAYDTDQVRVLGEEGEAATIGVHGSDLVLRHKRDPLTIRRPSGIITVQKVLHIGAVSVHDMDTRADWVAGKGDLGAIG